MTAICHFEPLSEKSLFLNFEIFRFAQYDKNSGFHFEFCFCYAKIPTSKKPYSAQKSQKIPKIQSQIQKSPLNQKNYYLLLLQLQQRI